MHTTLELRRVTHAFGNTAVLKNLSLSVREGEIIGLCGDSGCGKTTTLRIITGLLQPQSGSVLMRDVDMTNLSPAKRRVGMIFQRPALFPHKRVRENIAFRLTLARMQKILIQERVRDIAVQLDITTLLDRYPNELSGGQQQRVALAAELIDEQLEVMLFDEPFNSLDQPTREQLNALVRNQLKRLRKSAIFVTHDIAEARFVCDRIAHLHAGHIRKIEPSH